MLHDRQAQAFEYADQHKLPVHFKIFPPPEGRDRFASCKSQKGLAKNIYKSKFDRQTCQELLRDGCCWLSPYWDIDLYTIDVDNLVETRRKIITAFNKMCEVVFPTISETFNPAFCKWSDSSGVVDNKFKVSLHCVYTDPCIGFEYNRAKEGREKRNALHQFGKLCVRESKNYPALYDGVSIIDASVWSTNRAMRLVGCHKPGQTRVLKPVNADFDIDNDYTHTDIRAHMIARLVAPERPCRIKDSVELDFVPQAHVDATFIAGVAADIGCVVDSIAGNLVTLKTCPTGRVCPISGQRYMPGNNRCYLHIKHGEVFYRQHGVDGTKKIAEQQTTKKQYDMFHDLGKLLALYKKTGPEFTVAMIREYLQDTVIYIARPFRPEFVVKVDGYDHGFAISAVDSFKYVYGQDLFGSSSRCARFKCRVIRQDKDGNDFVAWEEHKIAVVLDEMVSMNQLRSYNDSRYVPFCIHKPYIGKNVFNTFVPFSFLKRRTASKVPFEQHAMYKLLQTDLTAGHPEAFAYLLDYIAHKIQKPGTKIDTALAFVRTIQGIGKGQFSKFIRVLFDDRNCKVVANLDHLFGNFNSHLRSSLWVFLEEIKGKGAAWDQAGRLKDLISSDSQLWEKKHHETEEGGWYGSIVIFSNNSYGIRVETSDRRYVLFDTLYTLRDNKQFHDQVDNETMDADYMTTAFQFFLDRDISKWNWRQIPKTKTRTAVKRACESAAMTFTRWLFENESNYMDDWINAGVVLRQVKNDYQLTTNKEHLVKAFRRFKETTGHPTKTHERNACLDVIKLLWGDQLKSGQFTVDKKRYRGLKVASVRKLQAALTKQFRDPVILQILQNESAI